MLPQNLQGIRELVEQEVLSMGAELIDLGFRHGRGRSVLTVIADKPGGITLDECAAINRHLGDVFDRLTENPEPYILEVNSPGLDRPLTTEKDFKRVIGQAVRIVHRDEANRPLVTVGKVLAIDADHVTIETAGNPVVIRFSAVSKAVREIKI